MSYEEGMITLAVNALIPSQVIYWIIQELYILHQVVPNDKIEFKITLDGRAVASHDQVLVGIVCTTSKSTVQSSTHVYPICIIESPESVEVFNTALKDVIADRKELEATGTTVDGNHYELDFIGEYYS